MLPLPQSWPIRCCRCGHSAIINAAIADLATKQLRCGSCGHRQPFAPDTIVRAPRRPNGRKARAERRAAAANGKLASNFAATTDAMLNDRLDNLIFAG